MNMIVGTGSDITDIRRVEKTLKKFNARFVNRVFTAEESARAEAKAHRAATYAKRFAAKEACAKALGTGLRQGVYWKDMSVVNLPSGQPTLQLSGGALKRLEKLIPRGMTGRIHLSLSDEYPYAYAHVIIEATES